MTVRKRWYFDHTFRNVSEQHALINTHLKYKDIKISFTHPDLIPNVSFFLSVEHRSYRHDKFKLGGTFMILNLF